MTSTLLKKSASTTKYDINQETDSQMLKRIGKKFALILVFIFMFDTIFDWFIGLLDLMYEGFHIIIEAVEYSIELILEYAFHTDHQHSEMIIVNGAILLAVYLLYRLYKAIPKLLSKLTKSFSLYLDHKFSYWQAIPLIRKLKLITTYCIGISCILFTVTL